METALPVPHQHRANPAAPVFLLCQGVWTERVKQRERGTIHHRCQSTTGARPTPWVVCGVHRAHGSSDDGREDPKFMY